MQGQGRRGAEHRLHGLSIDDLAADEDDRCAPKDGELNTKMQIKIIGIGRCGCALLDHVIASGLRDELDTVEIQSPVSIRFIGVETDIERLECCCADLGFYLGGGFGKEGGPQALEKMVSHTQGVMQHVIQGAHLVLVLTGLDDALECAAAAAVAELGRAEGAMTVSLVSLPPPERPGTNPAAQGLTCIAASSHALFSFPADDGACVGDAGFAQEHVTPVPAGNLVNCARVLAKAVSLPHRQLVGCDFLDIRVALYPSDATFHGPGQRIPSTHHHLRLLTSPPAPARELAAEAAACLPLRDAASVLLYIECGPGFRMSEGRDIVQAIVAEAPQNAFIKYCFEVDPLRPEAALAMNLYVRREQSSPGPASTEAPAAIQACKD